MGIITFDGVSSEHYNIEVSYPPQYSVAEPDYETTHVLGLNGDKLYRYGSHKNVEARYACNFLLRDNFVLGDVDGARGVTAADAALILRYLAGQINLTEEERIAADVNLDGKIDSSDASAILNSVTGLEPLPDAPNSIFVNMSSGISRWLNPYHNKKQISRILTRYKAHGKFQMDKNGYMRLSDTYSSAFYRKAVFKTSMAITNIHDQGGAFELVFNCTPEKWYNIGEIWQNNNRAIHRPADGSYDSYSDYYNIDSERRIIHNPTGYPAWPMIRIGVYPDSFSQDHIPTIGQIAFEENETGEQYVYKAVRWNMENLDELGVDTTEPYTIYVDTSNCDFYIIQMDMDEIDENFNEYTEYASGTPIFSMNGKVYSEFTDNGVKRFNRDTGILCPGVNRVNVRFWGRGELYSYRKFEILPRWWTL